MKRVQYSRYGGPEELRLDDVQMPEPARGQIRIRVMAAGANPMDWKIRKGEIRMMSGFRFPRGLGHDYAGVVDAVGPEVTRFKVGDEVFGATGLGEAGTFAEYLVTAEKNAVPKPPSLSFERASALTIVGVTAWTALVDKAKLRAGQSVFITGCLGGVGRAAVQLARARGAQIVGSCSASASDEARALGVDEVVDYRTFEIGPYRDRFDVVFDTVGVLSLGECDAMLKRGGVSLHIVPTAGKVLGSLLSSRHHVLFGNPTQDCIEGVSKAAADGQLVPAIGRVAPLSEAISAIVDLEQTGAPKGKLVIVPTPEVSFPRRLLENE
ncbi:MAG: NADP-dependent oxidoreductase [Caulobacteraceae bacterium]